MLAPDHMTLLFCSCITTVTSDKNKWQRRAACLPDGSWKQGEGLATFHWAASPKGSKSCHGLETGFNVWVFRDYLGFKLVHLLVLDANPLKCYQNDIFVNVV